MIKNILMVGSLFLILQACAGGSKTPPHASDRPAKGGFEKTGKVIQGHASWYGGRFHGRKTANGEIFNKNTMTAAHKSLPFGTVLEVHNPENNQSVYVRINDRGPFIKGRFLDLSQEAARRLGIMLKGTAKVIAEIVVPIKDVVPPPAVAAEPALKRSSGISKYVKR